jgi:hypothetical protein
MEYSVLEKKAIRSDRQAMYQTILPKVFMADMVCAMVQATRPENLAPALTDSPAGLAAWIMGRFHSRWDCEGDIERISAEGLAK